VTRKAPLLAAGSAAALALARRRRRTAAGADSPWPELAGRAVTVTAEDGVPLRVEVHGPDAAAGTVVLAHGYELSGALWDRQVAALLAARPDLRVVAFDQRGHGGSGRTSAARATLGQLGRDLRTVLDAVAPTGPVVLAGHSMGGMGLMAFAEQFPELVGPRVVAVALVSTSPGRLAEVTYGLPKAVAALGQRTLPWFNELARRREAAGKGKPARPGIVRLLVGKGAPPADVRRTLEVMAACPAATVADFHLTFTEHDRLAALGALAEVPVLVLSGRRDLICPVEHSEDIARALPHARLCVYPDAGHMLQLERHVEVSRQLVELVDVLPRSGPARRTGSAAT
jgi:pimeloyl-ACP methyl ester carboxylesterase